MEKVWGWCSPVIRMLSSHHLSWVFCAKKEIWWFIPSFCITLIVSGWIKVKWKESSPPKSFDFCLLPLLFTLALEFNIDETRENCPDRIRPVLYRANKSQGSVVRRVRHLGFSLRVSILPTTLSSFLVSWRLSRMASSWWAWGEEWASYSSLMTPLWWSVSNTSTCLWLCPDTSVLVLFLWFSQ